ncbi:hypothetical protein [Agaribacterium sp. ZY112]|uniref:hypothetical protein n=1 Tax=Agaribacterium sp. ZY112 TaxID=3233574 RepID=UPI003525B141
MSGGANKSFISNPLNFLRNNVLIVELQSQVVTPSLEQGKLDVLSVKHDQGSIITVNIAKDLRHGGQKSNGKDTVVYKIGEATGQASKHSHRFSAYYLPFMNNDFRTMTLGDKADYFFTDTMNGCSFACGPGKSPKIGHFNRVSGQNDVIDQNAIDRDIQGQFPGGVLKSLTKTDYKAGIGDAASLFGIRKNGIWHFYYQVYSIAGVTKLGRIYKIGDGMPSAV